MIIIRICIARLSRWSFVLIAAAAGFYPGVIDVYLNPGKNNLMSSSFTVFDGHRRIACGPLHTVALIVKRAIESGAGGPVLLFDDATGRQVDIDIGGSEEAVAGRFAEWPAVSASAEVETTMEADARTPRGRGRPKLGVVAREVTLLPRHWDWLASQPGGASVALRKLVEEARKTQVAADRRRAMQERAYHFMSAVAGNMPGFEEAARALFAPDEQRFRKWVAAWPRDVRNHAIALAFGTSPA
jgi:uncharacterized protein